MPRPLYVAAFGTEHPGSTGRAGPHAARCGGRLGGLDTVGRMLAHAAVRRLGTALRHIPYETRDADID